MHLWEHRVFFFSFQICFSASSVRETRGTRVDRTEGRQAVTQLPRGLNKDMKEIRHHVRERVFVLGTSSSGL